MPFTFREEEKPKFGLHYAGLLALLLLLLLFLFAKETDVFHLSAKELATLKDQQEQLEREMTFRFSDAAEDLEENPDAPFLSDAARTKRAKPSEEAPNTDPDPFSKGDTLDLSNAPANPNLQPAPPAPPMPQPTPPAEAAQPVAESQPEPPPEEPLDPNEQAEPPQQNPLAEDAAEQSQTMNEKGDVPIFDNGPKPYRRLSKSEIATAKENAVREMALREVAKATTPTGGGSGVYDNPNGSSAPFTDLSVETNRDDLGPYLKILRQLIKGNWRIPNLARFEVSGVTGVTFKIQKDGTITDVKILLESGHEPLDTASMNAVINTYKAPPLPPHVDEDWIPIKFGFYYNMRPNYRR